MEEWKMSELTLTSANFDAEVLKSSTPVVVDFYADWCGPCKMMGPVLEQLATAFEGKVKIGKFNVDSDNAIPSKYGISSIPCLILFKNGDAADRSVGYKSFGDLDKWIKSNI